MVQKRPIAIVVWKIVLRLTLLFIVFFISGWENPIALSILKNNLGYVTPPGFFGFTLADDFVSLELMLVFISGIFLGTLGKLIDYILILLFLGWALYDYHGTSTVTTAMYLGLFGATIVGNAIGFILKLLRQRFLPKLRV